MADTHFIRLLDDSGTWAEFESDWRSQCEALEEDFDSYAEATLSVVREIVEVENKNAGVFGLKINGNYAAMCQVNRAPLPGYDSPVMRIRFITLCPDLDLRELPVTQYGSVLASLLTKVIELALTIGDLKSRHIKFHLRSPADTQFFSALGKGLHDTEYFETVATRGAWLYITLR